MARTPLFAHLRRLTRLARAYRHATGELRERLGAEPGHTLLTSRRQLLRNAGLIGSSLAAGSWMMPVFAATNESPVAVVGAGIAGLTAAWRLRQYGVPVQLFEAQTRVGGRMLSLRNRFPDGQVVELGGELINSDHQHIRQLAAEFDIALNDLEDDDPTLAAELFFFAGQHRSDTELVREFTPLAAALEQAQTMLGENDITWAHPGAAAELDQLSIADWLDRHGVSGWMRKLLEVAYTTEMGLEPEQQSALNLLTLLGSDLDHFSVLGDSDERYHVRGGNDLIVQAVAGKLDDAIQTGSVLESIERTPAGAYRLQFQRDRTTVSTLASQIILALPLTLLREVELNIDLPPRQREAIDGLHYGSNAKLMIGFNSRPWRNRHGSNGSVYSDLAFQTCWETSRLQPGSSGVLTNFTGGAHGIAIGQGSAKQQAEQAVTALEQIFPGITAARTVESVEARMHWPSNPWVKGSYLCYGPGQWTRLRGVLSDPAGEVYFAGEHCALENQGYMEGACETGDRAAQAIIQRRGLSAKPSPRSQIARLRQTRSLHG